MACCRGGPDGPSTHHPDCYIVRRYRAMYDGLALHVREATQAMVGTLRDPDSTPGIQAAAIVRLWETIRELERRSTTRDLADELIRALTPPITGPRTGPRTDPRRSTCGVRIETL